VRGVFPVERRGSVDPRKIASGPGTIPFLIPVKAINARINHSFGSHGRRFAPKSPPTIGITNALAGACVKKVASNNFNAAL
jgi:hypothetical protein